MFPTVLILERRVEVKYDKDGITLHQPHQRGLEAFGNKVSRDARTIVDLLLYEPPAWG